MPLRDHFHPPLSKHFSWDSLHGQWPAMIVLDLNKRLPPPYIAAPSVHLGASFVIDVAAREHAELVPAASRRNEDGGAVATALWAPPEPTLAVATDLPDLDEYEVRIFTADEDRRLVAAIEIVSPANKERADARRTFAAKCAALLQQGVSVSIVDLVTTRRANLYADLLDLLGHSDPSLGVDPPSQYAVELRYRRHEPSWRPETWASSLVLGQRLPTVPLWLAADLAIPLDLESTYEETCRALRIA